MAKHRQKQTADAEEN